MDVDDELPALDAAEGEHGFNASDCYNSHMYDADGNLVSRNRKMHEHGYYVAFSEQNTSIFSSMHRRQVLSSAISKGDVGVGNQAIVVGRDDKKNGHSRRGSGEEGDLDLSDDE